MKSEMLDWALRYTLLGWPVFPLQPRGKEPLTDHGCKDATLDEGIVRDWWRRWPDANIGLATGGKFFAFDIDIKDGGEDSFDYLREQHGAFPDTVEQVTGTGGRHVLFAMPDFPVKNSTGMIAPGIDIRGIGGYIVAAPSIHPVTKRPYVWDGLKELEEQPIAPAPAWLLARLRECPGGARLKAVPAPQTISEGRRNEQLFKIGCSLRRKHLEESEILAAIREINSRRCVPPLGEDEIATIAKSAARYEPDKASNPFRGQVGGPAPDWRGQDVQEEIPLSDSDVEAAADVAVERNDMVGAVKLAREVAQLPPVMRAVVIAKFRKKFGRDWPARDFAAAVKDAAASHHGRSPESRGECGPDEGPDLLAQPLTDAGNGERIVALFGDDIRFCVEMDKWLIWDGRRWAPDRMGEMRLKAKEMTRRLYEIAIRKEMPTFAKHARSSESYSAITNALGQAATEPGIPISASHLDQHPRLLNCPNGTVDLGSGTLLPHDRQFLLTKLCPTEYDPQAKAPQFISFITWAMGANPDAEYSERVVNLVRFMQRAFGYALTSEVSEKAIFIFHGKDGNNGKTTLLTLFRDVLGHDYSGQLDIQTVMSTKGMQDATARADLADLRGVRFVVTSEVEKEHRLNEGKIKYLTAGMGLIKSCRKYENPIEFAATHKLFMDCNHRPEVRGVDEAIWKRLKLVPFDVTIEKDRMDLHLLEKLRAEGKGILAWAVRGCKAWMNSGLGEPPEITNAVLEWRSHDDPLKEFIEDYCEVDAGLFVRCAQLTAAYDRWAKETKEKFPLGRVAFTERLQAKGFKQSRSRRFEEKQARTWEGIGLKPEILAATRPHMSLVVDDEE